MGLDHLSSLVYHKGDDPIRMNHRILTACSIIIVLSVLSFASIPPTKANFIIASWDYPDEYGQGVYEIRIYQYINGWYGLSETTWGWGPNAENDAFEIFANATAVYILLKCEMNNTRVNASSLADGENYIQHSGELIQLGHGIIDTVGNFTLYSSSDASDPMFEYWYNCTFEFSPIGGVNYKAVLNIEIYW